MDTNLQERAVKATARYMKQHGCTILDTCWKAEGQDETADLVVMDGDTLVITKVNFSGYDIENFHDEEVDWDAFEKLTVAYLENHDIVDMPVRLDVVTLLGIGTSRALLRHHRGVYSTAA